MTGLSLLSPSGTSSPLHDDACIHGYPLFATGGLFRVRTGQPSEGDGRAGGNLPPAAFRAGGSVYEVFRGLAFGETPPIRGLGASGAAGGKVFGTHHDEAAGGRASAERLAEVLHDVPAVRKRQSNPCHACLQRGSIPAFG